MSGETWPRRRCAASPRSWRPPRQAATSSGISSGGCSKSASMTMIGAPPRVAQPGAQRGLMAEIAGERDIAHGRIRGRGGAQRRQRAVARAVVDKDDLGASERRQHRLQRGHHRNDVGRPRCGPAARSRFRGPKPPSPNASSRKTAHYATCKALRNGSECGGFDVPNRDTCGRTPPKRSAIQARH